MLVALIVGCEIAFWVILAAGLAARYLLRRARLGAALLICVPIVDLVLLVATVIDLAGGATAEFGHGLAAAYIGFSVAFGHGLIRWADEWFAHRFAGGPPPRRRPQHGWARVRWEWQELGKALLAGAVACALLGAAIAIVDDAGRTAELVDWMRGLLGMVLIWSMWPIAYTLRAVVPRRRSAG